MAASIMTDRRPSATRRSGRRDLAGAVPSQRIGIALWTEEPPGAATCATIEAGAATHLLMLFERDPKLQADEPPLPEALPPDVIVSPDTRRENRIPPGQSRTRKWPVLDASGTPPIDLDRWALRIHGLVHNERSFSLHELMSLPRVKVFSDFHCVTRWSRLGNLWEGISTREIAAQAGGIHPDATHVLAQGYDRGWTTNLPVAEFFAEDALLCFAHDGEALSLDHGGPVRLIIPRLYAWKSAKWLSALEFLPHDKAGFWEANGYHMHGDPWAEERYGY